MWRNEYRFQSQSDDSFQFEFLIRLKLYMSVFRDSVQFMYFFLHGKQPRNTMSKYSSTKDSSGFQQHARAKRMNPNMN